MAVDLCHGFDGALCGRSSYQGGLEHDWLFVYRLADVRWLRRIPGSQKRLRCWAHLIRKAKGLAADSGRSVIALFRCYLFSLATPNEWRVAACIPLRRSPFPMRMGHYGHTGARISEVLALTVDSVDMDGGAIVFKTLKQRQKTRYRAVPVPCQHFGYLGACARSPHGPEEETTHGRGEALALAAHSSL
jgi:hypothetical protein